MKCPTCNRENEESAKYCRYCGSPIHPAEMKDSNTSSIILFIWIIATCVINIVSSKIWAYRGEVYYGEDVEYDLITKLTFLFIILNIIGNLIHLLPAFAIKNKSLKIVGIIVMSIMEIWWIVKDIQWAISLL